MALLTREQVAAELQVSVRRIPPEIPRVRWGRSVRFERSDIVTWIRQHRVDESGTHRVTVKAYVGDHFS